MADREFNRGLERFSFPDTKINVFISILYFLLKRSGVYLTFKRCKHELLLTSISKTDLMKALFSGLKRFLNRFQ